MKNNTINLLHKIRESFFQVKSESCIKYATQYLEINPNDIDVRYMRARSYKNIREFDLAVEDLEYNIENFEIKNIGQLKETILELFNIYYYLNRYIDALKLLPIIYDNKLSSYNFIKTKEIIMKKQLRIVCPDLIGPTEDYFISQIINYDETRALGYIRVHQKPENDNNIKSKFNDNININYLFYIVKNNINHNNKANIDDVMEVFYFAIPNVGMYKNDICNYIKVRVIPNTKNVISIFPTPALKYEDAYTLEYDRDKLFKIEKQQENRPSQITKFYNRYKRV